MSFIGKKFAKEFVIGFGFLSGVFLSIGIDPQAEIIKNIIYVFFENNPDFLGRSAAIFNIISILILIVTLYTVYKIGRNIGLLAILFAFTGGFLIISSFSTGIILLLIGSVLGFFAPKYKYRFL